MTTTTPIHLFVAITITTPAVAGMSDNVHAWSEWNSVEELILEHDPFQDPIVMAGGQCGCLRPLSSIPALFAEFNTDFDDYHVMDSVVMDYWESRNETTWWTPLCSSRSDVVRVGTGNQLR